MVSTKNLKKKRVFDDGIECQDFWRNLTFLETRRIRGKMAGLAYI
jgi:hypothetical protein